MKWAPKLLLLFLVLLLPLEVIPLANQKLEFCQDQRSRFNPLEAVSYPRDRSDAEGIKDRVPFEGKNQLLKYEGYKKKIIFIVNPISGLGKQKGIEKTIQRNLDLNVFDYEVLYTKGPHDATKLSAEAAAKGVHIIVAVGGDGSVNEVAQGMIGTSTALAIIPTGSGNGFARHFNIPSDLGKAVHVINAGHERWIDTVKINQKSYLGVAGIGFDADVSLAFSNLDTRGPASYLFVVLSQLPLYKPRNYQLIIDGKPVNEKAFLICFANTQQYGNNAFIAPHAKVDDGLLDVIIWKKFPPHAALKLAHDLFTKHLEESKYTHSYRCQEVILKKPLQILHIDGEPMEVSGDVYIRVLPSSLKMIAPK